MVKHNSFCFKCRAYNCHKHPIVASKTVRLQQLLEHFQEPNEEDTSEKDMRIYIEPEKTKPNVIVLNSESTPRRASIGQAFNENHIKSTSAVSAYSESKPMPQSTTSDVTTSAMVIVNKQSHHTTQSTNTNGDELLKLSGKNYKPHERHHFVKINNSSFVSCSSPTGNYSELAFVLWIDNKSFTRYVSSERYRVVINLIYDAEEDLWCVSAKLLKRASSFNVRDEEEGHISNRLCVVNELRSEIKKMLLYLGISPREAYKSFRRNMEEDVVITDSGAGFVTVESAAHEQLLKNLEKTSPTNVNNYYYDHHGYSYGMYPHGRYHQSSMSNMRDNMKDNDIRNKNMHAMYAEYNMD